MFPKTKPISIGILYKPPRQTRFLEQMVTDFESLELNNELYILGDFNIDLLFKGNYILNKTQKSKNHFTGFSPEIKKYNRFCSIHGFKQLINCSTRITCNASTIIDHILTNAKDNISQPVVINTAAISDHNMIHCTRKIRKTKYNKHKEITFRSLRKYSVDIYKQALERASFPNYDNFHNPDIAYNDFINRLACVINAVAPFKTVRVKNNTSEWFDGEIADKIHTHDKLYKRFKLTKLHVDGEIYKEAPNVAQNLIRRKKKAYFENKLKENTKNPKKLWKTLKQSSLPDKRSPSTNICLETENGLTFDPYTISEVFKKLFSNLANDLVHKLPTAANKFGNKSVEDYDNDMFNFYPKNLTFQTIQTKCISDLLKNCDTNKAAGIDNLSGGFLKDGADILTIPITQLYNLFIKFSHFPKDCKVAKLKPLSKKGTKTDPKNFRSISLLPMVSKIIEKVIHDQTMNYLTENSILYRHQSGFRKNHSTDTSFAYLTDKILAGFDSGLLTGMILIDLQKAFYLEKCLLLDFLIVQ